MPPTKQQCNVPKTSKCDSNLDPLASLANPQPYQIISTSKQLPRNTTLFFVTLANPQPSQSTTQ